MVNKNFIIGKDAKLDPGIYLGYLPERLPDAQPLIIGDNARVRCGTVIYAATRIGNNLQTGHNAVIREENQIGDGFYLWSNSVIDYGCKIGDNVKIHTNCYIAQFTVLEDEVFLAPGVVIANDIHPGCEYSRKCMRGPLIKRGAKIGVNVTILPFISIGENSLIGAGSVVAADVPADSVVYGNPARVHKNVYDLKCISTMKDKPYSKR